VTSTCGPLELNSWFRTVFTDEREVASSIFQCRENKKGTTTEGKQIKKEKGHK
jgi:hypothetical protein